MNNPANVSVRLSAAGIKHADGKPLSVHGGRVNATFQGDSPQEVHRTFWNESLRTTAPFGEPWFELVPPAAPVVEHEDSQA